VARSNPAVAYPPDAYAGRGRDEPPPPARVRSAQRRVATDQYEEPASGTSPTVWIAGLLAIVLLATIAFLVFQLLSGPSTPAATQVSVPNWVGRTIEDATREADGLGLTLKQTPQTSDQPPGTILAQGTPPGTNVAPGTEIAVTVASGVATVPVPDLRNKTESEAVQLIADAGLRIGTRNQAFDGTVPIGQVISQSPSAGVVVAKGTTIDYTVSQGASPSPSLATPTPTVVPTPPPTPVPTSPPTPPPTPTPTAVPTPPPTPTPTPS